MATRPFQQTPWSGEPVDGRAVLVWGEQGVTPGRPFVITSLPQTRLYM